MGGCLRFSCGCFSQRRQLLLSAAALSGVGLPFVSFLPSFVSGRVERSTWSSDSSFTVILEEATNMRRCFFCADSPPRTRGGPNSLRNPPARLAGKGNPPQGSRNLPAASGNRGGDAHLPYPRAETLIPLSKGVAVRATHTGDLSLVSYLTNPGVLHSPYEACECPGRIAAIFAAPAAAGPTWRSEGTRAAPRDQMRPTMEVETLHFSRARSTTIFFPSSNADPGPAQRQHRSGQGRAKWGPAHVGAADSSALFPRSSRRGGRSAASTDKMSVVLIAKTAGRSAPHFVH